MNLSLSIHKIGPRGFFLLLQRGEGTELRLDDKRGVSVASMSASAQLNLQDDGPEDVLATTHHAWFAPTDLKLVLLSEVVHR